MIDTPQTPYEALCSVLRNHVDQRLDEARQLLRDVPVEFDTTLFGFRYGEHQYLKRKIRLRLESWGWEGFYGRTCVLLEEDVGTLSDQELWALVQEILAARKAEPAGGSGTFTISRGSKFVLVNFGFHSYD